MEVQWDTGTEYATRQIIKARTLSDGSILFVDISRGADGVIDKPPVVIDSGQTLKTIVMRASDSHAYRSSQGSWMMLMKPEKVA